MIVGLYYDVVEYEEILDALLYVGETYYIEDTVPCSHIV